MALNKLYNQGEPETPAHVSNAVIEILREENMQVESIEVMPVDSYQVDRNIPIPADNTPVPESRYNGHDGNNNNPLGALQGWIEQIAKSGIDENKVREIVDARISAVKPRRIEIKQGTEIKQVEGRTHYQFELVLRSMSAGVNLALAGSTATSKTTMAVQAAKSMNREYAVQPVNEGTTKADILGYCSATGEYIPSLLYTCMKLGKILIVEEIDCGSPASLLAFNNAVDNREMSFPNGELLQAHENFMVICTMNTKGTGADRKFVGRNRLDAATLDRFCILEVERDLALEAAIIGVVEAQKEIRIAQGGLPPAESWLATVREKREQYSKSHPDKIVSMRAVRDGWKLISAGIGAHWATKMCIDK